jgi:hypothetical protein
MFKKYFFLSKILFLFLVNHAYASQGFKFEVVDPNGKVIDQGVFGPMIKNPEQQPVAPRLDVQVVAQQVVAQDEKHWSDYVSCLCLVSCYTSSLHVCPWATCAATGLAVAMVIEYEHHQQSSVSPKRMD